MSRDIPGQTQNHGVAIVPAAGRGFISDGKDGSVVIFDLKTYGVLGKVKAEEDADGIIYDPASNKVLLACGDPGSDSDIARCDPMTGPADPAVDSAASRSSGRRRARPGLRQSRRQEPGRRRRHPDDEGVARWSTAPAEPLRASRSTPTARRLFIGCRKPQKLVVMSSDDGSVLADFPIGPGVDATKFNGDAYASCRDGTLTIIRETSPGKFGLVGTVRTRPGARTMGVDTGTGAIYLPTAVFSAPPGGSGRPVAQPGSFMIVVVKPTTVSSSRS